jgi:UDP-2,3-diacylglucosamine hydrolase
LQAPAAWHRVDLVSDLHLSAAAPATLRCFLRYLAQADFDALFILGDLFEVWVGDDVLAAEPEPPDRRVAQTVAQALRALTTHTPVHVMRGNRDFLLGPAFERATGCNLLEDPCVLDWHGRRYLLSHGDAWCLDDRDYMRFRAQVRSPAWQAAFLAQPLATRETQARAMRAQSRASQNRSSPSATPEKTLAELWADVDTATAQATPGRPPGHDPDPRAHPPPGRTRPGQRAPRWVLSDWDADAQPPRAEALTLFHDGRWQRRALTG